MYFKSLLKITSLLLFVAAMMMPTVADAQSRKRSGTSLPSVQTIENVINKLMDNKTPALPSGIKILAKKTEKDVIDDPNFECGTIVVGQNAEARINSNGIISATAAGSHAWYLAYTFCTGSSFEIFFITKADRDQYWKQYKKSRYFSGSNDSLFTRNGWYGITLLEE